MKKYFTLLATTLAVALSATSSLAQHDAPKPPGAKIISQAGTDAKAEPNQTKTPKSATRQTEGQQAEGRQRAGRDADAPKPAPTPKPGTPEDFRGQIKQLQDRLDDQKDQLGRQQEDLKKLQNSLGVTPEGTAVTPDLGPLGLFTSPLVFWTVSLLFLAGLTLHAVHLLRSTHTSRVVGQLWNMQQRSASAGRTVAPSKNSAVESLNEQVRQQGQGLGQFTTQLNQLQSSLAERDRQVADAVQAVALTANWVGYTQLREAAANDGGQISEADRAAAIALLERYEEPLRANAGRVEPLSQSMAALVEKLEAQPQLPAELVAKAQSLHQGIGQFDLWLISLSEQLSALRRGSFSRRSAMLQADQQRLIEQVDSGGISIAQMVQKSRELLDQHFPRGAQRGPARLPSAEDEAELKKRAGGAPDFLMDWFDSFSQFHGQVVGGQAIRAPLDPEITDRLSQVQMLAREVLSKFDIQPEEIQVGRTGYDRRLHEMTLVRQSAQFPTNTVIEVLRCGFRRMSTGEVLRRPQVVVAGAAAG